MPRVSPLASILFFLDSLPWLDSWHAKHAGSPLSQLLLETLLAILFETVAKWPNFSVGLPSNAFGLARPSPSRCRPRVRRKPARRVPPRSSATRADAGKSIREMEIPPGARRRSQVGRDLDDLHAAELPGRRRCARPRRPRDPAGPFLRFTVSRGLNPAYAGSF